LEASLSVIFLAAVFHAVTPAILTGIIVVVILLICSAMVSGSEVAFFSLSPADMQSLKESSSRPARNILKLLENPERLLANILISNNFINVGIITIAAFVTGSLMEFPDKEVLAFIIEVGVITILLLLFGEILPKIYANRFARGFAYSCPIHGPGKAQACQKGQEHIHG
jgi:Mg2+/Co2+ transporter CorB